MKNLSQALGAEKGKKLASFYASSEQVNNIIKTFLFYFLFPKNIDILSDMYIKVKIKPNSKQEIIKKTKSDHYEVAVKEKAENNRANDRLLQIMHKEFPNTIIKIISGHHSPSKILSIENKEL